MTQAVTNPAARLSPREQQIFEYLADGSSLAEVGLRLGIRQNTVQSYLSLAKLKLGAKSENAAALAAAYALGGLPQPKPLDPSELSLPREQLALVPLLAQGMRVSQMASVLKRPVSIIRRDARGLMKNLRARNAAQTVKRTWQYQLLTADQVLEWLT
ncbi:helix-turn-helix transcriptional regulator [Streptomyces sp. NA02950]|uniref:helix-turn-helix domain-containing protein n=1 Tax=Streptomyces sp. NA02950 TaxID=2742137 RepID=UPI0020CAFD32|nr:helix-turn-helix transcriptional regulator [Streptomyces sp. NA02950]